MSSTRKPGRPVLGAISGFFLGLFTCTTLFLFGVIAVDDVIWMVLPLVGLVAGIAIPLIVRAAAGKKQASAAASQVPITPIDEMPPAPEGDASLTGDASPTPGDSPPEVGGDSTSSV